LQDLKSPREFRKYCRSPYNNGETYDKDPTFASRPYAHTIHAVKPKKTRSKTAADTTVKRKQSGNDGEKPFLTEN